MRNKTLDYLIQAIKCESSNLNNLQKKELIEEISIAINSNKYCLHTDESIESSIVSYLDKNGPSSYSDIAKGIKGYCAESESALVPYVKDLVEKEVILHNGHSTKGSKYYTEKNPVQLSILMRVEKLSEAALLSPKEEEVLLLLVSGFTSKEIGKKLSISHHTISGCITRLRKKLNVSSIREIVWKVTIE